MAKLVFEFKRWFKSGRIFNAFESQGVFVTALIKDTRGYIVGSWEKRKNVDPILKFRMIESYVSKSFKEARNKYIRLKKEYK